ncbi:MAG: response regulator [Myxococcales bacterium]|nr:response regulator [Myxococcales bacterium]
MATTQGERILVVDDNEINRDLLRRRLSKVGFLIDEADGYTTAMERMALHTPDLILLDIMMPEINGVEMLKRLRKTYSQGELPIIMVTAKDESEGLGETLQEGANDYITKPVNFPVALARIKAQLMRKRAESALKEGEARLRDLFEHASDMIHVSDEQGHIVYANNAFCEVLGLASEDLEGASLEEWLHPAEVEGYREVMASLLTHEQSARFETRFVRRDGGILEVEGNMSCRLFDGNKTLRGIFRDITERKRVEMLKNEFVSIVSHELRTPLTSIMGSLGLMVGGVVGQLPEQAMSMLDIAYKNSQRLLRLINDILDIEKIESGKMDFYLKRHPLRELVEQAIEANRAYGETFGARILLEVPDDFAPEVLVDNDRLIQVLTNLLSNALKFSPKAGVVRVSMKPLQERVLIEVIDQGPGIPLAFQSRVFEKFAQAESANTRQKGGTGLGLSIARAIVERLHGEIGFRSEPGVGTTFFFSLPNQNLRSK